MIEATIVTDTGAVLRELYHKLTPSEIETVLMRMRKGDAFPEHRLYDAGDERAMSHSWFAQAIDPAGVERAVGAAADRADAAALDTCMLCWFRETALAGCPARGARRLVIQVCNGSWWRTKMKNSQRGKSAGYPLRKTGGEKAGEGIL